MTARADDELGRQRSGRGDVEHRRAHDLALGGGLVRRRAARRRRLRGARLRRGLRVCARRRGGDHARRDRRRRRSGRRGGLRGDQALVRSPRFGRHAAGRALERRAAGHTEAIVGRVRRLARAARHQRRRLGRPERERRRRGPRDAVLRLLRRRRRRWRRRGALVANGGRGARAEGLVRRCKHRRHRHRRRGCRRRRDRRSGRERLHRGDPGHPVRRRRRHDARRTKSPATVLTERQGVGVVTPAHVADHGTEGTKERVSSQVGLSTIGRRCVGFAESRPRNRSEGTSAEGKAPTQRQGNRRRERAEAREDEGGVRQHVDRGRPTTRRAQQPVPLALSGG